MSTSVTISGSTYSIPSQGQSPPWGEELSDLLNAMVTVLNSLQGTYDIATTSFTIANNQSSAANITGLSFNTAQVRSAIISYSLYRSTDANELAECGQIYVVYKSTAATWEISNVYTGSAGVTFTITTGGQVKYESTNVSGSSYTGTMKFKAVAFAQ